MRYLPPPRTGGSTRMELLHITLDWISHRVMQQNPRVRGPSRQIRGGIFAFEILYPPGHRHFRIPSPVGCLPSTPWLRRSHPAWSPRREAYLPGLLCYLPPGPTDAPFATEPNRYASSVAKMPGWIVHAMNRNKFQFSGYAAYYPL